MWFVTVALAQTPAVQDAWQAGLDIETQHMTVLSGWAGANLVGGTVGALLAESPRARAFHGTNAAWNTVNLGIAVAGGIGVASRRRAGPPSLEDLGRQHRGLRTALAVNLGLDVVYVGSGIALWGLGGEVRGLDLPGVGQSLVLQGAFLGLFDAVFLARHRAAAGVVGLDVAATPTGMRIGGAF